MKILDATCGTKSMWYEKNHPLVTYLDIRKGDFVCIKKSDNRKTTIRIHPDIVADWTKTIPFDDEYFDMVLFDPPHMLRNDYNNMESAIRYGFFKRDEWKQKLIDGIKELFRVLKLEGVFIFKWSETNINLEDVLSLFPYKPIFGNKNRNNPKNSTKDTYWLVFLKYEVENDMS